MHICARRRLIWSSGVIFVTGDACALRRQIWRGAAVLVCERALIWYARGCVIWLATEAAIYIYSLALRGIMRGSVAVLCCASAAAACSREFFIKKRQDSRPARSVAGDF